MRPPPDYPASPYPFLAGGALAPAARDNAVVSIAARYLGVPYKWGGASPMTGFDCSGLVKYVFAQLGVSLPHYAASQWYSPDAVPVPAEELQTGDLVFFIGSDGTRRMPGHVGIYVGDGYFFDAPHTGSFVRIDSLNAQWFANEYVGARRISGTSLHALRRLHAPKPGAPAKTIRSSLPMMFTLTPLGESPGTASAGSPGVRRAVPAGLGWIGVGFGGMFGPLLAGGLVARLRRRSDSSTITDSLGTSATA